MIKYISITILFFILQVTHVYSQKKNKAFLDVGLGIQHTIGAFPSSSYNKLIQSPNPKMFLGFGLEHKINERLKAITVLNINPSKIETKFSYHSDTGYAILERELKHYDFNFGLSFGIKYNSRFCNNGLSFGTGLNLQKVMFVFESEYMQFGGIDSTESFLYHYSITPKSSKVFFNSIIYYLNVGYFLDRKKKWELLLDANTTLNGPVIIENILYYNDILQVKSINKVNMGFLVLKLRILL